MKYLMVLLVILFVVWLWKRGHSLKAHTPPSQPAPPDTGPQTMVACFHCNTHVPEQDAVRGAKGIYCSTTHLHVSGDRPISL